MDKPARDHDPAALMAAILEEPDHWSVLLDQSLVKQGGLRAMIPQAWPILEGPSKEFIGNWHIDAICEHLTAVSNGEIKRLAISMPPRHMKPCYRDGMVIIKGRGRIPLHGARVGDLILTHHGRYRRIEAVHDNGLLPTVTVRTWAGRAARMAPDHPVLTARGWVQAGELQPGRDVAAVVCARVPETERTMPGVEARLLGYLVGDGTVLNNQPNITTADPAVLSDVQHCASELGWHCHMTAPQPGKKASRIAIGPVERWSTTKGPHPIGIWLTRHGLLAKSSRTKRVPQAIVQGSEATMADFLGAYWDCDGSFVHRGRQRDGSLRLDVAASATTVSEGLAHDLLHILTRLGIRARVRPRSRIIAGEPYAYFMVEITVQDDVAKLVDRVPMRHSRSLIPRVVRTDFDRYLWADQVMAVEPAEPAHCICLTVEEDHSFVFNDLAVHNSLSVSVSWLAWDWIDHPWRQFLFASYAQSLAYRDSVKTRRLVSSPWYRARWGDKFKLTGDQNTKSRFENDKTGHRLSTSVGGATTGEGGDIVIVDDAHNVRNAESEKQRTGTLEWWDEALSSRLNNQKTGAYVLVQQRVHENDLMGHVLKQNAVEPWTTLCLPAEFEPDHPQRWFRDPRKELGELLWPERMGRREMDDLKQRLGPYATAAQLQQRPSPRAGGIFKRSWFPKPYLKFAPADTQWVRGWDFAASEAKLIKADPDYTASVKVGWSASIGKWIIGDAEQFREEQHVVERMLKERAEMDGTSVQIALPQDPGGAGKGQAQGFLRLLARFSASAAPVTGDKMARALTWAGKAGAGLVLIVEGDWNKAFLDELTSFPTGAHDDQVDAISSAFDKLLNNTFGLMDYYEQQLRAKGVDVSALRTPLQRIEEEAAEATRKAQAASDTDMEAMIRAMGGKPR